MIFFDLDKKIQHAKSDNIAKINPSKRNKKF